MQNPSRASFLAGDPPAPLVLTLPAPPGDPLAWFRRQARPGPASFLLESGKGPARTGRYSFFGSDPYLVLTGRGTRYELTTRDRTVAMEGSPFAALAGLMRNARLARPEGLPPFLGGAVGILSYDAARWFENIPSLAEDDVAFPDLAFAFYELTTAYDHVTRRMHLVFVPSPERLIGESRDKLYREGCERLAELRARMTSATPDERDPPPGNALEIIPDQSRADYVRRVGQCQDYIRAGDIYQANLSHRFTIPGPDAGRSPTSLYARLRSVNPSPFAGLLTFGEVSVVSSSPERLIALRGRLAETRPIAGTRPRGGTPERDRALGLELLGNAKERAEHVMLVDLERNDLGRVCRYGSVRVDEFMVLERYSHVTHIVSNVTGVLRDGYDAFDVVRAVFPGGTITGVPKIRCMEIIEELEPVRRGPYTGSFGYFSWTGDADLNIIIRTLLLVRGRGYLQVGAGIVADSHPEREYEETLHKAEAVMRALRPS
jgi:aminodeoxychorismate synthase component I